MSALRKFRVAQRLSQAALAKILGCSQVHVSDLERGERSLRPHHLARLYAVFGVLPEELGFKVVPAFDVEPIT